MASTIKVENITTPDGTGNVVFNRPLQGDGTNLTGTGDDFVGAQHCKAWVNFNGTGTVAIRDSYNVSSITDGGTGYYTINFSSSMANANYSVTANTQMNYGGYGTQNCGLWATTTTSTTIRTMYGSYGAQDYTLVTAQIFSN